MKSAITIILLLQTISLASQDLNLYETMDYLTKTISETPYHMSDDKVTYTFQYIGGGNILINEITDYYNIFEKRYDKRYVSKEVSFNILDLDIEESREKYSFNSSPDYIKLYPKYGKAIKVLRRYVTMKTESEIVKRSNRLGSYEIEFVSIYTNSTHKKQNIFNALEHVYDIVASDQSIAESKQKDPFERRVSSSDLSNKSNQTNVIRLKPTGTGVFEIPVIINDVLKINFVLDTGASGVSLSSDVALTLIRTGSIAQEDFREPREYSLADGSIVKNEVVVLKSIEIGKYKLTNIEASISENLEAPMLMGGNVLEKLGKVTVDYSSNTLIIN